MRVQDDSSADTTATSIAVIVDVIDVNDNAPTFVSADAKVIQADTDVGVVFYRVLAVDADSGAAGRISYSLDSGDADNTFSLDAASGQLALRQPPRRRSSYRLGVTATDAGVPSRSGRQTLRITVAAEAGGPPKFGQSVYRAEVAENGRAGALVTTVAAADKRSGDQGVIYSMEKATTGGGLFNIDERSGEIVTMGALDREARDEYILTVYVHDVNTAAAAVGGQPLQPSGGGGGGSYDTATVLVRVLDENDNTPRFADSCYSLFVPENTDLSSIHRFVAVDADIGANADLTYSLVEDEGEEDKDDSANRFFSLDAHTGVLSAPPLDAETRSSYRLTVRAEDAGSPRRRSVTCRLTVRVTDRNDNDPVFAEAHYTARVKGGYSQVFSFDFKEPKEKKNID